MGCFDTLVFSELADAIADDRRRHDPLEHEMAKSISPSDVLRGEGDSLVGMTGIRREGRRAAVPPLYPGKALRHGSSGAEVERVQRRLLALGITVVGSPDGDFGDKTEGGVRLLQTRSEDAEGEPLEVDGIVGPRTWAALFGSHAIGAANRAAELANDYATTRHQFARPIRDFQGVEFMLADMAVELFAAKSMLYRVA